MLSLPKESTITYDDVANDKNIKFIDTHPIVSPHCSNESISSLVKDSKHGENLSEPRQEPESLLSGHVMKNVYLSYFTAGGSTCTVLFFFFTIIFTQILMTGADYWITFWYCV